MPKVNFGATGEAPPDESQRLTRLGENLTVFSAPSKSRPNTFHFVIVYPDHRGITCTCEGWRYNRRCWHVEQVPLCMAEQPSKSETLNVSSTFNFTAIAECYYVEGHQGGHSWE
jgi:hypothetical protein